MLNIDYTQTNPFIQTLYPSVQTNSFASPLATSNSALNYHTASLLYSAKCMELSTKSMKYSEKSQYYNDKSKEYLKLIQLASEKRHSHNNTALKERNFIYGFAGAALIACIEGIAFSDYRGFLATFGLLLTCLPSISAHDHHSFEASRLVFEVKDLTEESTRYNQKALNNAEKAKQCLMEMENFYDQAALECTNGKDATAIFDNGIDVD